MENAINKLEVLVDGREIKISINGVNITNSIRKFQLEILPDCVPTIKLESSVFGQRSGQR